MPLYYSIEIDFMTSLFVLQQWTLLKGESV